MAKYYQLFLFLKNVVNYRNEIKITNLYYMNKLN